MDDIGLSLKRTEKIAKEDQYFSKKTEKKDEKKALAKCLMILSKTVAFSFTHQEALKKVCLTAAKIGSGKTTKSSAGVGNKQFYYYLNMYNYYTITKELKDQNG